MSSCSRPCALVPVGIAEIVYNKQVSGARHRDVMSYDTYHYKSSAYTADRIVLSRYDHIKINTSIDKYK